MSKMQTKFTTKDVQLEFARNISKQIGTLVYPVPDGQIHRFDDPEGKPGNRACWYLLSLQPSAHGAYGNWRHHSKFGFTFGKQENMPAADIVKLKKRIEQTRSERNVKKSFEQKIAAQTAVGLWQEALPASIDHPYLLGKSIPPLYIKQSGSDIIIGLRDNNNNIVNIQRIDSSGQKRFLRGGRVKGCYAVVGEISPTGKLYLCEGWATGLTLYLETGVPAACAMSCHNLCDAGDSLRRQFPNLEIVIAGDDDRLTRGNPGRTAAISAALALGSRVRFPKWPSGAEAKLTDFNDLYVWKKRHGLK